jgi:serine/threonine-protein kinase
MKRMYPEQLGPYRIGRPLGRGGMGSVFAAVEVDSGQLAAVKVLSARLGQEPGFRERFAAEIESLRQLNHPNIVRLLGFGEEHEFRYFAMELVEGRSLQQALNAQQRFDWARTTEMAVQVCRALKHAHDRGVIHRDLKPANLLLTDDGIVKLSDFGIARLFGSSGLTADGVIGTADYMSPEQADGRGVSERSDLYSLGCVLYTLLAGQPPFKAKTLVEMLQLQRFAEPEPLRVRAPDVPIELAEIVHQLLAKEPAERIPSALILSRRLEATRLGLAQRSETPEIPAGDDALDHEAADDGSRPTDTMPSGGTSPGVAEDRLPDTSPIPAPVPGGSTPTATTHPGPAVDGEQLDEPSEPRRRFTPVSADELDAREPADEPVAVWRSWHTWVLLAGLLVTGGAIWYSLQPPSADKLYERIMTRIDDDSPVAQLAAKNDIQKFLELYPQDARLDEVVAWKADVEFNAHERKLSKTRGWMPQPPRDPVERALAEAVGELVFDPQAARLKFQAIVDLYGGDEIHLSPAARQAVESARRQLAGLEAGRTRYEQEATALVERQLARADRLATSDPQIAERIWRAIVALYGDKTWAASAVARARERLGQTSTESRQAER